MSDITIAGATAAAVALQATTFGSGAYIGVGDSATAFSNSQVDLQASINKLRKIVSSSSVVGNVLTLITAFSVSEANYAWTEVGAFAASSGGTMLVRKVANLPTKTSSDAWTLQLDITFTAG